jgi:uncharacterized protein (TIGR03067 family)
LRNPVRSPWGTAKINPSASPRSVDIRLTTEEGHPVGEVAPGVYEVRGDTLRVCFAPWDKPRPKRFESREGSGHNLFTLKRVKP